MLLGDDTKAEAGGVLFDVEAATKDLDVLSEALFTAEIVAAHGGFFAFAVDDTQEATVDLVSHRSEMLRWPHWALGGIWHGWRHWGHVHR